MESPNKDINFLVDDIYELVEKGHTPSQTNLELFGKGVQEAVASALMQGCSKRGNHLRMSNIGTPDRKLWFTLKEPVTDEKHISAAQAISFMYGHIIEQFVLFLVREAGYVVTDEQKEVSLEGVDGHLDCKIEGFLFDVKGMSSWGFTKFSSAASLVANDTYGYVEQISGYAQAEGKESAGFLVFNKERGTLALCLLTEFDLIDARKRIKHIKAMLEKKELPERCYQPIPDGKSGNMMLDKACSWCQFKKKCYNDANGGQGLRAFQYANEIKWLTHVAREPNVREIKIIHEKDNEEQS